MAEIIDEASELEEHIRNVAIANLTRKDGRPSRLFCADCSDEIPALRRELVKGCQRCASCQEDAELRAKMRVQ